MCRSDILDKAFLFECFVPNFDTGELIWRVRPTSHFATTRAMNTWNSKYAGKEAGAISKMSLSYKRRQVSVKSIMFKVHQIVWIMYYGSLPDGSIDHIDRDACNNAITNLREATKSQQCANTRGRVNKVSEYKGVTPHGNLWQSRLNGESYVVKSQKIAALIYDILAYNRFKCYSNGNSIGFKDIIQEPLPPPRIIKKIKCDLGADTCYKYRPELDFLELNCKEHAKRIIKSSCRIKGVSFHKKSGKFFAYTNKTSSVIYRGLGYYTDYFEACCARKAWEASLP